MPRMYFASSEPITFSRDCEAILVPQGERVVLPAGSQGYITQALGGSFTVYVEGNLFRIRGADADAIGKEPTPPVRLPENAGEAELKQAVWDQLRQCYDPEIPVNIVDLGLVYECRLEKREEGGYRVEVKMTLTAPGCGMGEVLVEEVRDRLEAIPGIEEADVELVFDPPWNREMMSEAARLELGVF